MVINGNIRTYVNEAYLGNKIITATSNGGITIENTTVLKDEHEHVYIALTGDRVALTDIRIL